ncbi:unnamed protein product, partial [Ectocarpus sp. 13 AM-2016]
MSYERMASGIENESPCRVFPTQEGSGSGLAGTNARRQPLSASTLCLHLDFTPKAQKNKAKRPRRVCVRLPPERTIGKQHDHNSSTCFFSRAPPSLLPGNLIAATPWGKGGGTAVKR